MRAEVGSPVQIPFSILLVDVGVLALLFIVYQAPMVLALQWRKDREATKLVSAAADHSAVSIE